MATPAAAEAAAQTCLVSGTCPCCFTGSTVGRISACGTHSCCGGVTSCSNTPPARAPPGNQPGKPQRASDEAVARCHTLAMACRGRQGRRSATCRQEVTGSCSALKSHVTRVKQEVHQLPAGPGPAGGTCWDQQSAASPRTAGTCLLLLLQECLWAAFHLLVALWLRSFVATHLLSDKRLQMSQTFVVSPPSRLVSFRLPGGSASRLVSEQQG